MRRTPERPARVIPLFELEVAVLKNQQLESVIQTPLDAVLHADKSRQEVETGSHLPLLSLEPRTA